MSSAAIALACVLLAAATVIFIFLIDADASDSAPRRSRLDSLLERRDAITITFGIFASSIARANFRSRISRT